MKYNLDNLHWQEFEILSFKILQKLIAPEIQFFEGGNDKGRDIVYEGKSNGFRQEWAGKWIVQVKHKSSALDEKKISKLLSEDLKKELTKIFVTNKIVCDCYILVTNKAISGNTYDEIQLVFNSFKLTHSITCNNFDIISYRHLETCIEESNEIKWSYPNIISHPDFEVLIRNAINYHIETRKRGWLKSILNQREKFVFTQFFQKANEKISEFPAIILSGPPKSGKTFNAEMLALNYCIYNNFQPILIDSPDEIEKTYSENLRQIFICDDAFGKHALNYQAEEWFKKLDRIFSLIDKNHLIIFTSREYIFRAFLNYGNTTTQQILEKIIVESHNYTSQEKFGLLYRYTTLSILSDNDKTSILSEEKYLIKHKNFSPETIRAFFANLSTDNKKSPLQMLKEHLEKPDAYLSEVFFKLDIVKQAALLSVLCSIKSNLKEIHKTFSLISKDLSLNSILNTEIEFDELNDSILRILKSDEIEEVRFYHPSMQEFLIRQITEDKHGKLREIVLKNLNVLILSLSQIRPTGKSIQNDNNPNIVKLSSFDINYINTGFSRRISDPNFIIFQISGLLNWFRTGSQAPDLKLNDKPLFDSTRQLILNIIKKVSSSEFYYYRKGEDCREWAKMLFIIKSISTTYFIEMAEVKFVFFKDLIESKKADPYYWELVFRILWYENDEFVFQIVGRDWLNNFYSDLKSDIYKLGYELFGNDFPEFNQYRIDVKRDKMTQKRKFKPNKFWYPRYIVVQEKIDVLKENKGTRIGMNILNKILEPYEELKHVSDFAKNRHWYNIQQGWWES